MTSESTRKPLNIWRRLFRVLLPLLVLGVALAVSYQIYSNKPEARKRQAPPANVMTVETQVLQQQSYTPELTSYGVIQPRSQSSLIAQVSGQIQWVAPAFNEGGFFNKGDVLLKIDDRDYQAALQIARANVLEAGLRLSEEKARVAQAERDWKRLAKPGEKANDLVLRRPQLAAAEAALSSARANVTKAKLDLERTQILAPYDGRIREKNVDFGQFVNTGTNLGSIYATDYLEVRLPLNSQQQAFVDLPEQFLNGATEEQPLVRIQASIGRKSYQWLGRLVRTEGVLDASNRQLYVIARIDDPYSASNADKPQLKIGQFVTATIEGRPLEDVFVLPQSALKQDNQVILFRDNQLERRNVGLLWRGADEVVVDQGLAQGEQLVTSPVGSVVTGTRAKLKEEADKQTARERGQGEPVLARQADAEGE